MGDHRDAQDLLDQVVVEWAAILDPLCAIVADVWWHNLDRHDPGRGDDALTLGFGSSRNVCTLAVPVLAGIRGVAARDRHTLEVGFRGRLLHAGKVGPDHADWDVDAVDWAGSDLRTDSARANSHAYVPLAGTLFEGWGGLPGVPTDPAGLRHLHLAWQGLADGTTRCWLGFPRDGATPWFAVTSLAARLPVHLPAPRPPLPSNDHAR